ncbi:hypothetical protein CRG98_003419 [Punica granatum]|uniref:Uncharacterized protein n=1 Tax=Punica granatum TaxID=22663 RepID=A0A2I0L668_PUNGR|nr:hypothetical protein CRG98_003419 [Punica granatum]
MGGALGAAWLGMPGSENIIGGGTAEVGAGTDAETGTGTGVEMGGGTSIGGSNIVAEGTGVTAGRLAGCEKEGGAGRLLTGWAAGAFTIVGADFESSR